MTDEIKIIKGKRKIRSHCKSRQGCFRCKTKRIKCNEGRPRCSHCLKNAAQCLYSNASEPLSTCTAPDNALHPNNPLNFHLRDLRLFHDFMTASWPHLPLQRDDAWRHEIPIVAQQHEFLIHAILALGAAHLHAETNLELGVSVERHRAIAMRGLNDMSHAMETKPADDAAAGQMTAILAAAYLLTFTASYMGDSFNSFIVFTRACSSITQQIIHEGLPSPLLPWSERSLTSAPHIEVMQQRLCNAPALPAEEVQAALASLERLERECSFLPFQQDILDRMRAVLLLGDQPPESYKHFVSLYTALIDMSSADFAAFTDEADLASAVLQTHFLAIEGLLRPWLRSEMGGRDRFVRRDGVTVLPSAVVGAEGATTELVRWPLEFLASMS